MIFIFEPFYCTGNVPAFIPASAIASPDVDAHLFDGAPLTFWYELGVDIHRG